MALLAIAAVSPRSLTAQGAQVRNVPYVDAHSHFLDNMAPDEQIALFRKIDAVRAITDKNPG